MAAAESGDHECDTPPSPPSDGLGVAYSSCGEGENKMCVLGGMAHLHTSIADNDVRPTSVNVKQRVPYEVSGLFAHTFVSHVSGFALITPTHIWHSFPQSSHAANQHCV